MDIATGCSLLRVAWLFHKGSNGNWGNGNEMVDIQVNENQPHKLPFFSFTTSTHSFCILLFKSVLAAMVAPSRWRSTGESQPTELSPGHIATAQPGVPNTLALSPHCTQPTNATAQPGQPDKPASRRTSELKHADEAQVRHSKQAKKTALKDTYQQISAVQANMAIEQEDITKDQVAMRPKPRIVQKKAEGEVPVVLGSSVNVLPAHNSRKSNYTVK